MQIIPCFIIKNLTNFQSELSQPHTLSNIEISKKLEEITESLIKLQHAENLDHLENSEILLPPKPEQETPILESHETQPKEHKLPSDYFIQSMEKKLFEYNNQCQNPEPEEDKKDPFVMVENSNTGSVILNNTFNNANHNSSGHEYGSSKNWLYKTSVKYKNAIVDYDKSSSLYSSFQNPGDSVKIVEKDPVALRKTQMEMLVNSTIPEKSQEQESSNINIAPQGFKEPEKSRDFAPKVVQPVEIPAEQVREAPKPTKKPRDVLKPTEKENIKEEIIQSIKSLHSRLDSIHTVLSANNVSKEISNPEQILSQRDSMPEPKFELQQDFQRPESQ